MKTLITTVALVALAAAPVLAQTRDRTEQRVRVEAPQTSTAPVQQQRPAANRANDVYDILGQRVGSNEPNLTGE